MAKEKKTIFNSLPKNPMLFEDVKNSSNLQKWSSRPSYKFDFSNIVDDPIEIEEVEDPPEDSEQWSAYREETSSEDNSQDTSSAPTKTKKAEGSLD